MSTAGWIFRGIRPPIGPVVVECLRPGTSAPQPLRLPRLSGQLESRHSPTGFEWGYGGSGPAELARAMLMLAQPSDPPGEGVRHPHCYQRFKFQVIATLPRDGWVMSGDRIDEWLTAYETAEGGRH